VLTDTGRIVFARGQEMVGAMRLLASELQDTRALQRGSLTVGIPPMINLLFTPVLKAFRERHPDIELIMQEDTGQVIERMVAAGELEIGMTILPVDPALDLLSVEVASFPIWAVAKEDTFHASRTTIRLADLGAMPLVLLKDEFALTRSLRHVFLQQALEPKIAAQSGQWDWLVSMASAGIGVALLPEPFIKRLHATELAAVRVVEPDIYWRLAHIWNGRYLSHAARAWLEVCQTVLGGLRGRSPAERQI
jgi:DNA-binding transcriptional LysR family regulator